MHGRSVIVVLAFLSSFALAQQGGSAVSSYPPTAPIVTPPIIDLNTVSRAPVGATSATGGLEAGATNSTLDNVPATEGSLSTEGVVTNGAPASAPGFTSAAGRSNFNAGVGMVVGGPGGFEPLPGGKSLGEIAREYRARKQAQNTPTATPLTDLNSVGGTTGALASTITPPAQPADTSSAASQTSGRHANNTPPVSTSSPQYRPAEMAQATTPQNPASTAAAQQQSSNATSNDQSANAPQQQSPALPRTASPLPLLALGGFACASAGLWIRRRRRAR
jgi:hypothetical protein